MPDPLPEGEVLKDVRKKEWKLGSALGSGGFGLIYRGKIGGGGGQHHKAAPVPTTMLNRLKLFPT